MDWLYSWLEKFVDWIYELYEAFTGWLLGIIAQVWDWLVYVAWEVWDKILSAMGSLLAAIPAPAFYAQADNAICDGLQGLGSFLSGISFTGPLGLVISAYVLRFVIRRLPVIG